MKKFRNVLWGIVLVAIGIILALNALGIAKINLFFDGWWTLFIIVPSFIGIFSDNDKTGNFIGLLIGVALLLCCQDIMNFEILWKLLVPAILVIIGISLIFKDAFYGKINKKIKELNQNKTSGTEYCATFAGQNVNFDNQEFNGADLTAVFGGVKCDLRRAIINGDQVVNCSATFGGIEIFVPYNVNVKVKSTPIFGGVSDKANHENNKDGVPTIYINATSVFGGVEIK